MGRFQNGCYVGITGVLPFSAPVDLVKKLSAYNMLIEVWRIRIGKQTNFANFFKAFIGN